MLTQEEGMEVVGQGANGEEALSQMEKLSPNVVLMDIKMPGTDGIELTRQVKQKHPSCNVIMLTLYDQYLLQAIEAGAKGYLLKDIQRDELTQAIRQVHQGRVVISESIKSKTQMQFESEDELDNKPVDKKPLEEVPSVMVEEVQLVLPPPVEANQMMRFVSRAEEALHSPVLEVIGSWQEGTIITIILPAAASLSDILGKFKNMSEIEAVGEKLLSGEVNPKLLKKAEAIPRLQNRMRKTIFVTLEKCNSNN
jgi:CheY-like chemotaxis protein